MGGLAHPSCAPAVYTQHLCIHHVLFADAVMKKKKVEEKIPELGQFIPRISEIKGFRPFPPPPIFISRFHMPHSPYRSINNFYNHVSDCVRFHYD